MHPQMVSRHHRLGGSVRSIDDFKEPTNTKSSSYVDLGVGVSLEHRDG